MDNRYNGTIKVSIFISTTLSSMRFVSGKQGIFDFAACYSAVRNSCTLFTKLTNYLILLTLYMVSLA